MNVKFISLLEKKTLSVFVQIPSVTAPVPALIQTISWSSAGAEEEEVLDFVASLPLHHNITRKG